MSKKYTFSKNYDITQKIENWQKPKEHENHTVNLHYGGCGGVMHVCYDCSCGEQFIIWEQIDNECLNCIENDKEWWENYGTK